MNRLLITACSFLAALAISPLSDAAPARPNIIVIMADDMGFSDLGCYGGEIQTPNLDKLAAEGMRFSQFYNCALCGPTRAALMTGLHPHQAGITNWTGLLNEKNCTTMFEIVKAADYQTCAVGRLDMLTSAPWHDPQNLAKHVDHFFGTTGHSGPGNYFVNVRNTAFYRDGKPYTMPEGGYKTDLITDFTVEFLQQRDTAKPFLIYMGHYAPHWPLHAKPADIAKHRALYREPGWDAIREQRLKRLVKIGMLREGTELSPLDERAAAWSDAKFLDWEAERMAVYAAQIDCLDQSVGRVMETLRTTGADKNTLVLFLSDNGASDKAVGALDKPNQTWRSDGVRTRAGNKPDIMPGPADTFVTGGPAWSCVANTPFRHHKQSNHEGGISSPLIAWWPGVVGKPGSIHPEISHITDITETVLHAALGAIPSPAEGKPARAGRSLLPVLETGSRDGHPHLCWATSGCKAVRAGAWKLVSFQDKPWELYNMTNDRSELHDLARVQPERVAKMAKSFAEWLKR